MTGRVRPSAESGSLSLQIDVLREGYLSGALSPEDVAQEVTRRARARARENIWTTLRAPEDLRRAAAQIARRWPDPAGRPPLFGVPVAVKDNIDVAGLPTTAACPDFSYPATRSAPLVRRLADAGALVVGKTNLDQFATGLTGTRSPYGVCRSAFDPERVAGGSSSGSALAVAHGLVSVAIGTDTAGSGRVPAAFANIVGLKPSRGLVSTTGIVPACRSLDCPSVFALCVPDAVAALLAMAGPDQADPWSRAFPPWPAARAQALHGARVAAPDDAGLAHLEDAEARAAFEDAVARLAAAGAAVTRIDIEPFLRAGDLLYQGPWVAERLTHLEDLLVRSPESIFPVTREVLSAARAKTAVEAFRGMHALAGLSASVAPVWGQADALMLPTAPGHPTVAQALADPHGVNAKLGRYTTFCNLLDLAAVSAPAAFLSDGTPMGVTFYAPAGQDPLLAAMAESFHAGAGLTAGATGATLRRAGPAAAAPRAEPASPPSGGRGQILAVVGAHRTGQPLHGRLRELGGCFVATAHTAPVYRLLALSGEGTGRPGLVRVNGGGAAVEVELHRLPAESLGSLLGEISPPLGLGAVELADGRVVTGFLCECYAMEDSADITAFGSWPSYLAQRAQPPGG